MARRSWPNSLISGSGREEEPRRARHRAALLAAPKADALLRCLTQADPTPMLILSSEAEILSCNQAAADLFKREVASLERTPLALFFPEIVHYDAFRGALASAQHELELILRRSDEEEFPALLSWVRLPAAARDRIALWIRDVGEAAATNLHWQKLQQETERSAAAKSMFLATMSHELRTPMNGLLGMLELLGQSALSAEQREMVEVIQESGRTLQSITDEILDLSKIEAGKLVLDHVPFVLHQAIEEIIELVANKARKKGVELAWWADPSLPDQFLGDPIRIKQIGLNLLSNAVKFTDRGSVILRLHGLGGEPHRPLVRFEVTDTGIGLTPEQQERLFQPFSQADHSHMRHFGGTGLGLSICHRLTAMMGGEIGLVSSPGTGSTFWVEIPLEIDPMIAAPSQELAGITALVVDDLPESRATMARQLRSEGAAVLEASDPVAADELLAETAKIDVAIVDLPDGLTALLPALAKRLPPSAILATLTVPDESATAWCAVQGLGMPILKPLRKRQLVRAVNKALDRGDPGDVAASAAASANRAAVPASDQPPILVAEDNSINRLVLTKQLRQLGFTADMADHGETAWAMLQERPYQLLLTDCIMPVLDGYELARRIRRHESHHGGHLRIVALTANVLEGEAEKCRAAGMDDYISKPLTLDRLAALLHKTFSLETKLAPEPAGAGESRPAPIDWAILGDILGSRDPADLHEVAEAFAAAFGGLLADVARCLANSDRVALTAASHTAKGAAKNAAANKLADYMAKMELDARNGAALFPLQDLLSEAEAEYQRLLEWLATR